MRKVFFLIMLASIVHGMLGVNDSGQESTTRAIEAMERRYKGILEELDKNYTTHLLIINNSIDKINNSIYFIKNSIDKIKQTKGYKDGDIASFELLKIKKFELLKEFKQLKKFEQLKKDNESNYSAGKERVSLNSANYRIIIAAKEKEIEPEFTKKSLDALLFLSDPAYQVLSTEDKRSYGTLLSELIEHLKEKILEKGSTKPSVTLEEMAVALELEAKLEAKFKKLKVLQQRAQKFYSELPTPSYVELFKGFISGWWYGAKQPETQQ